MASERITLLPDDRALKVLAMDPDIATGGLSTHPHVASLSEDDLAARAVLNRDRCRHLGLDPAEFPLRAPLRRQVPRWDLRLAPEVAPLGGKIRCRLQILAREPLPGPHLVFADGLLLYGGLFRQTSPNGRSKLLSMHLPRPPGAGTALALVSGQGLLRHRSGDDLWIAPKTVEGFAPDLPGTDLRAALLAGEFVTKKGNMQPPRLDQAEAKTALAELYARTRAILQTGFGYGVMVSHGTLLGLVREGDLIENDDDFDCAYLSAAPDCAAVIAERPRIVAALKAAGLTCRYSTSGNIRVRSGPTVIDLMPAWFEGGRYNVSGFTSIPLPTEAILPFRRQKFLGTEILLPAQPELVLEGNYGPKWRVPDPFYRSEPNPQALHHKQCFQAASL